MLSLDIPTLLVATLFTYFLVAALILVATLQGRQNRILWWLTSSLLVGGTGVVISVINAGQQPEALAVWLGSSLPIVSHACLWTGIRRFTDKPVSWPWLFAGAVVFGILCLWPGFVQSAVLKVMAYSLIALGYICAAIFALWPELRRHASAASPVLFFLAVHGAFNLYRMIPRPSAGASWMDRSDLIVTLLESIFFTTGLAFTILAMVRTRTELHFRHASLHDALTGLPNRRALFEWGQERLAKADNQVAHVTALMCDLDWFKQVNDQHGHAVGDRILVAFAKILRDAAGPEDLCARLGGEEFVVLTSRNDLSAADELAERIRRGLLACSDELPCRQTVSIGIAHRRKEDVGLDRLLSHADQALYAAKMEGRDRVETWPANYPDGEKTMTTTRSRYRPPGALPVGE